MEVNAKTNSSVKTPKPTLLFSEYAWTKINWFMKKAGNLEISGYGITPKGNALYVQDFETVLQECDGAETEMDSVKLAE